MTIPRIWRRRPRLTFTCYVCRALCTAPSVGEIVALGREHQARCIAVDRAIVLVPDGVVTVKGDLTEEQAEAIRRAFDQPAVNPGVES